ncbi:MAG TPA: AraC family transcriptional regulator [Candidatus Limnocylindrales bacterium]|nr:AraC family transcriptional regulator [Candidatus Limnocylindrales bacterium]
MTSTERRQPATLASWSATLIRALDAHGIAGAELARRAGIDPESLRAPETRVARASLTRLWELAVQATGDPCFGLTAARYVQPTTFHALGYAVLASATLKEALERIIRYRRLIGDIVRLSLIEEGEEARFVIDVSSGPGVPYEAVDAFTAVCVRQTQLLRGEGGAPRAVLLQRPEPAEPDVFTRAMRAPVLFEQPVNAIVYARAHLEAPLPAANAELARQNDEAVARYLARLDDGTVMHKVRQALLEALPQGAPSKQAIGRKIGMSARNLQRRLDQEGTSFKQLLEDARLELARSYMDEGRYSITEIAFLLGFSDTSSFSRAFKRWTGSSPRAARTKNVTDR